ncbi:DEAD/DEAH box helicase [Aeromicrobium chenweiae]|uniref:Helicase n=1 Tax=Aeromicrobium chenweiae TaxID=2079793 RepID=A0A2S0WI52_9ACTN|nr:DEAD/DEAH box helicase [Aeromicrobium chenweiae]AWB91008.1 helicase [Aeromicrobium chenweiae]TGN31912.1 DEAD/DEAH box helicase [Aeromicrobium chenweiae]
MDPADLVLRYGERVTHVEHVPAREAVIEPWPEWVDPAVREMYAAEGITSLWGHQAEALHHVHEGRHTVISTGTASGKSLAFQAPALTGLAAGRTGSALRGNRMPTVLYLAPTKALAADQLRRLAGASAFARPATVDGDNSREERAWARDHANYLLTNPDTLHHSILPGHARWTRVLGGLTHVVVDECHHYRGVFGAHVAHVLRRLRRICAYYGADPTFVLSSATVAEPEVFASRLTGLDVVPVTEDSSPHAARTIALWEPPIIPGVDPANPGAVRRSATTEAGELLTDLVIGQVRTLAFVRSRRGAETVAATAQRRLGEVDPELVRRVATYRGGYLPEERRELEHRLRSGDLLGLASTNALELGIDIAGLDAVITVGFPGTRAALQQQFGRAGRSGHASIGILVARDDPLDTFLVHHPEALLGTAVEASVFDPDNPYVLGPHLAAAAQEIPLTENDFDLFGPRAAEGVTALEAAGWLRKRAAGWFWTKRERASNLADIRSSGGSPVQIVDASTGRLIGTVDGGSADSTVHEGAVYVHQGDVHLVDEYDLEHGVAIVHRDDPDYSTMARSVTEIAVTETERTEHWGAATMSFGSVEVVNQVVSYLKRSTSGGGVLGEELLELPARTLQTKAVWWTLSAEVVAATMENDDVPGSAHAAEHAAIGLLPLLATCDRWDIGGVSTALHPDTGTLTVFVYDGYPGGAGFAERGYEIAAQWLRVTRDAIVACECQDGCPSCVQSPKCGNGNEPLDKAGAVRLLDAFLVDAPTG